MAGIDRIWCLRSRSQDKTIAVWDDEAVYGGAENERNEEAHYILIAKADENDKLTFISGIDNTTPLTGLSYQFIQSADGSYRLIEFNPNFYSNAVAYVAQTEVDNIITVYADMVWSAAQSKFYICIQSNTGIVPGVTSGWAAYWTEISNDIFITQISSNKGNITIHNDIITFRYEDCEVEKIDCTVDDLLCGICNKWDELFPTLAMQLMLDGANSNNWQEKQARSEFILVQATKKFCC